METIKVGGANVNKAYSFALSSVSNVTEFSGLFDAYRLNKVFIRAIPLFNTWQAAPDDESHPSLPQIVDIVDYDDATILATSSDYLEFGTHRIHRGDKEWKRKFTPACAINVFQSATATGYKQAFKQWINLANASIPHYGYKLQLIPQEGTINQHYTVQLWATLYFSCKQLR